jgi:predicted nuclease with RNAse H fold
LSKLSDEQNFNLGTSLKETGWPTLVIQSDSNSQTPDYVAQRKAKILSEIKANNIRIVIIPDLYTMDFDNIKIIACLDPPDDTLNFLKRIPIDSLTIIFGTEEKLHPMIETCKSYDATVLSLPIQSPSFDFSTPLRNKREYSGIVIAPQDMNIYREMSRKARNIKHLMETESWTHPRHQDISRKILLWQKEVRKAFLDKEKMVGVTTVTRVETTTITTTVSPEETESSSIKIEVASQTQYPVQQKQIRKEPPGNFEQNSEL